MKSFARFSASKTVIAKYKEAFLSEPSKKVLFTAHMLQEVYYDNGSFFSLVTGEKYPLYDLCRIGALGSRKYSLLVKGLIYYYHYIHHIPMVDRVSTVSLNYNKFTQQIILDHYGLAKLRTQFYVLSKKYLETILDSIESVFSYPLVVKNPLLERGLGVELISSRDALYEYCLVAIQEGGSMSNMLVQQFFSSPNDYRAVVIGGKILGVFSKSNPNGFKHNVAQGGKITAVTLYDSQKKTIIDAVAHMGLDVCGVDFFMNSDGDLIFIEFNDIPQYAGFEETSGLSFIQEFKKRVESKLA